MEDVIQGLWIGNSLSTLEQLSIRSFLANRHEYHLYVYEDLGGVPPGTTLKDARTILPASMIFSYTGRDSYAGFANFFRYKLLLEQGGWWVDSDVICVKPFRFSTDHVLATERDPAGHEIVTSGIIKAPRGSDLMSRAWAVCQSKDPKALRWGETGPGLMQQLAIRMPMCGYIQEANVFCPIDSFRWWEVIMPRPILELPEETVAVHLWNEGWRSASLDKNEQYAPNSLLEKLKREYLAM